MALSKITNDLLALGENTSSLNLPKGTTAQRPVSPVAGMVRENTDDNVIEYYNGTEWKQVKTAEPPILADYLVVAGGGGAGGNSGAAGGAGGLIYNTDYELIKNQTYNITVGSGGTGWTGSPPTNGNDSVFNSITSLGGGAAGLIGGSGGGAAANTGVGASGTAGQGNNGGSSFTTLAGAGGGGSSFIGGNASGSSGGSGGNGSEINITGTPTYYSGGGGGGGSSSGGSGGLGGGGNGGYGSSVNGLAGSQNSGGGSGSGWAVYNSNTQGGSGVVILRLLTSQYSGITTGSPTVTTDGSHTVLTYTSSGTYTA